MLKHFESNKTISFKVIDNKLLKKYTKISKKQRKKQSQMEIR